MDILNTYVLSPTDVDEILPVSANGAISGFVYQVGGIIPLAGVTVTANGYTDVTIANGSYSITVPPGRYVVTPTGEFTPTSRIAQVVSGSTITLESFILEPI